MRIRDYFHFCVHADFTYKSTSHCFALWFVGVSMYYGSFLFVRAQSRAKHNNLHLILFAQLASKALPASDAPYESQTKAIKELRASMGTQFAFTLAMVP